MLVPSFTLKDHTLLRTPQGGPSCIQTLELFGSLQDNLHFATTTSAFDKQDDIVYMGSGGNPYRFINSVDVSNPASPVLLDSIANGTFGQNFYANIVTDGTYLYVTASGAISVIDPAHPTVGTVSVYKDAGVSAFRGAVYDSGKLYVVSGSSGSLFILDVSNPFAITLTGSVTNTTHLGTASGIAKSGNYVFIAAQQNSGRMAVVDVSNPASPTIITSINSGSNFGSAIGITVSGNYAYVTGNSGLNVVDISTPTSPTVVGRVGSAGGQTICPIKDGNYVYMSTASAFYIYDVTTPSAPVQVGSITSLLAGKNIVKSGNYVFYASETGNLVYTIDVTTPSSPSLVATFTDATHIDDANGLLAIGSTLYVSGLAMASALNITTPTALTLTRTWHSELVNQALAYAADGDYMYVGLNNNAGQQHIGVIDISDPTDMYFAATLRNDTNLPNVTHLVKSGNYLFSAHFITDRISVTDVSDPLNPTYVSTITHSTNLDQAQRVEIQGNYAYIPCVGTNRLTIVDISNPASLSIVGTVSDSVTLGLAINVTVSGNYAYVCALSTNRLTVVDISNPASPTIVGSVNDSIILNRPISVVYSDGKCFVGCQTANRITVIDVSDPTAPFITASLPDNTYLNRMTQAILFEDDLIYVPASLGNRITTLLYNPCESGTRPTVTINQGASQADPTTGNVVFDVVFSEAVSGFATGVVSTVGSTAGGTLTATVTGSGPSYTVTVTGMTSSGTVVASIPAYAAVSVATGLPSQASTSIDNTVTVCIPVLSVLGTFEQDKFALPYVMVDDANYLYVGVTAPTFTKGSLYIYDKTTLTVVGSIVSDNRIWFGNRYTMAKSGNYLYIGTVFTTGFPSHFTVVDVSTPSAPAIVASITDATFFPGSILSVYVYGNYAYCMASTSGLVTVNITNPLTPTITAASSASATILGASGTKLYLSTTGATGAVFVYDITTPSSPSYTGFSALSHIRYALEGVVDNDIIWWSGSSVVGSLDISTPTAPFAVGGVSVTSHTSSTTRMSKSGNAAIVVGNSRASYVNLTNRPRKLTYATQTITGGATNLNNVTDVVYDGSYAWIVTGLNATGDFFTPINWTNPNSPSFGTPLNMGTNVQSGRIFKSGNLVYVPQRGPSRLAVYDVSTPGSPTTAGTLTDTTNLAGVNCVHVVGNYAYLAGFGSGGRFTIVDVTSPASMSIVSSTTGANYGTAQAIYVDGNYAYIGLQNTGGSNGPDVTIIDISTPGSPSFVGRWTDIDFANGSNSITGITVDGNTMYVSVSGSVNSGIVSVDITTKSTPVTYEYLPHTASAGVTDISDIDSGYIYVTGISSSPAITLMSVDVNTPSDLSWVGSVSSYTLATNDPFFGGSIDQDGDTLFIASSARNFAATVDVTNPDRPALLTTLSASQWNDGDAKDIVADATNAYVLGDGLRGIYKFDHSLNLVASVIDTTSAMSDIKLNGNVLYTLGPGYLGAISVSDPPNPVNVGAFGHGKLVQTNQGKSMCILGNYIYVADSSNATGPIYIFDITTPSNISFVTIFNCNFQFNSDVAMVADGNYLYIRSAQRFHIIDVTNRTSPSLAGSIVDNTFTNLSGNKKNSIVKDGNYVYTVDRDNDRLLVIDVSNTASPSIVGNVQSSSLDNAACVIKDGNYCYVGTYNINGPLAIVNVTTPTAPTISGSVTNAGLNTISSLVKAGNYVYCGNDTVTTAACRISVVNVSNPAAPTYLSSVTDSTNLTNTLDLVAVGNQLYAMNGGNTYGWLTKVQGACL